MVKRMRHLIIYTSLFLISTVGCNNESVSTSDPSPDNKSRVVFRSDDGRELTAEDLASATGTFEYEIVSTNDIPDKAHELHQQARQLGAAGEYEKAIKLLSEAELLAPNWPYPTYDMAFTFLLMKDFAKAREYYEKTVELSPRGFFTAVTALDTLNREATGDLPEGTYIAYVSLEWVEDPAKKAEMINVLVERLPQFAPAWKEYALQLDDPTERLEAIENGLNANPDAETKGILLINKALTLSQQGQKKAAKEILGNLALDPNTTLANEHLAKQTMVIIAE